MGGKGKKIKNILQRKKFLDEVKSIFDNFLRAIIWWKKRKILDTSFNFAWKFLSCGFPITCLFCFFRGRFGGTSTKKHVNYFVQLNLWQQIEIVLKSKYLSKVFLKILLTRFFIGLGLIKIKLFCDTKEIGLYI